MPFKQAQTRFHQIKVVMQQFVAMLGVQGVDPIMIDISDINHQKLLL